MLIIRRSKLYYTASGIITLKQVSGLKLLKYDSINMRCLYVKATNFLSTFFGVLLTLLLSILLAINQLNAQILLL